MNRFAYFALAAALLASASLAQTPKIGDFKIENPGGRTVLSRYGVSQATMTGPATAIRGPNLELYARSIWAQASGKPLRVTDAKASGSVRVVRRNPTSGETIVITSNRAELKAGAAPRSGHIDFFGRTTIKTFDKDQNSPQPTTADNVTVDFDATGETIGMDNLDATVPVQEKRKPKTPAKPAVKGKS